jgi:hypothetical protein
MKLRIAVKILSRMPYFDIKNGKEYFHKKTFLEKTMRSKILKQNESIKNVELTLKSIVEYCDEIPSEKQSY